VASSKSGGCASRSVYVIVVRIAGAEWINFGVAVEHSIVVVQYAYTAFVIKKFSLVASCTV